MNKHITIPFFIPHEGCPNQCVFCNQHRIAGTSPRTDSAAVREKIVRYTEKIPSNTTVEAAFFGGSFTALPISRQTELLHAAWLCRKEGLISRIRLSTRPDCIDNATVDLLLRYGVTTVEIGAQSFDNAILEKSKRGHSRNDILNASSYITQAGLELIIQLMIGLPGETAETIRSSAEAAASLNPSGIRIYPVLVIADTELESLYRQGSYTPLSLEDAVEYSAELLSFFASRGINVIRTGIHPMENAGLSVIAGPYHTSFGFLAKSRVRRNELETIIMRAELSSLHGKIKIALPRTCCEEYIGDRRSNIDWLSKRFSVHIEYTIMEDIECPKII